ncbi:membrane protein insertion efficiency factor YidD [Candidatus Dependentiae bacterium]|nr:membrane protein insertion efficiency factor YidD [Candidatus Dependentiae bacterium]MCC7415211.1 membrane protein insertion efficiency factor YidD [Campylobacterota bacterium]
MIPLKNPANCLAYEQNTQPFDNRSFVVEMVCVLLVCIRPLFGPARCRYQRGCTSFAVAQLRSQSVPKAIWAIVRRLGSCCSWQPLKSDLF